MATRTADLDLTDDHAATCFHCGDAVPPGVDHAITIAGKARPMCCIGCAAAATAILGSGLDEYYRVRDARARRPQEDADLEALKVYDDPLVLKQYARGRDGESEATLVIGGMTCAACAWLLERRVGQLSGVQQFEVSLALGRATLRWNPAATGLAEVLAAATELGFTVRPYSSDSRREAEAALGRDLIRRLGVAAACGVQVMMISLALYLAAADGSAGMDPVLGTFMRYAALLLSCPIIAWSALPFFRAAWSALTRRTVNMDVPVSIALLMAFGGSSWHTLAGRGEIYFDSVAMFVTLLLASRYLELRARIRAGRQLDNIGGLLPDAATRLDDAGKHDVVPVVRLAPGDRLWVRAGEVIAADGVVECGASTVDEALQSGESTPHLRRAGDTVLGGSVNLDAPLTVRVSAVADASYAGQLAALVARAAGARHRQASDGGRLAQWFVAGILAVAAACAGFWWLYDASRWFEATLAVLVVSCPCALAIARPAALAAAHASLLEHGVAVIGAGALERLARVRHVFFDKTGTLTRGEPAVTEVRCFNHCERQRSVSLAQALAQAVDHPLTRALRRLPGQAQRGVTALDAIPGRGVAARFEGQPVYLGSREFMRECGVAIAAADLDTAHDDAVKETWLGHGDTLVARFSFADRLREEAPALVRWLDATGLACGILSGDREAVVARVAGECGISDYSHALDPAAKLAAVSTQEDVVMVGDGLNDAPVMAAASVSVAVADATGAARQQADVLLLGDDLNGVRRALATARRARRIVRQNHAWAIAYNVCAIPLAATGMLPPWAAAIGMSASSLVVVGNALRARVPSGD